MSGYRNYFNETKYISFFIKNDGLLEKYTEIWDNVSNSIKKGFGSQLVYNEKHLQTKIKSYERNITTYFLDDRIPKEGSYCICLSVILIDSVFK